MNTIINFFLVIISFMNVYSINETPVFTKGGKRGLDNFVISNLIYPDYSRYNCLQGTIEVSFQLNRKGKLFNSRVEKGLGIDLDEEALRVVRLTSGRWTVPTGFDTTQSLTIPINFSLKEYNCETKTATEIQGAIAAYRTQEALSRVITNYYSKKSSVNTGDEQKIIELKNQLGFDDQFIDRLLKQAQRKLKQGDKDGACEDLNFVKNIGSNKADKLLASYCN